MKAAFTTLTLAAGASAAAVLPRDAGCCFGLTASGGVSGTVSQLSDGQNRVGGASSSGNAARYCLNNGGITDGNGRGCILTPPTTQFQCDSGATPTTGFSVSGSGNVAYNGNTQFVACPVNDNGEYNIYTTAPSGQGGCKQITLSTGGACSSSSSSAASSAASSSAPASSAPVSSASMPASSAPASSAPASSAPASSAPAPSAPAPSASMPASSAPASSAPAPSAPAPSPSAPASSAPAPKPSVQTVTSCTTYEVTHSAPAPSAPASSAPAPSMPASSAPAPSMPANSAPASSAPQPSAPASSAASTPVPATGYGSSSAPASSAKASSSAPAPSAPVSSAPATSPAATKATASGSACATTLQSGAYQTPHLIVPVNKNSPSTSYGTQYDASINQENSTIFQFDIPQSYAGKQCSLVFLWPKQSQLETSSFTTSGSGGLTFGQCSAQTTASTTYQSAGDCKTVGSISNAAAGNSYVVASGPCAAGQSVSYEASATGSLSLSFFEDWNPSPIGAFITSC